MRALSQLLLCFATTVFVAAEEPLALPINRAIAETAENVSISIRKTDAAMDGGSILNDIDFSDGRQCRLVLDVPIDLATDKVIHPDIHFTVFVQRDWAHREDLAHGTAAERRLLGLLNDLAKSTHNSSEKKNAETLIKYLSDRHQSFPRGHGGEWDLSPW